MPKTAKLTTIPKPQKQAIAIAMRSEGVSLRQIGKTLGVDHVTVKNWTSKEAVGNRLAIVAASYQEELAERNKGLLDLALTRLEELIPKSESISEVLKAAEFARGKPEQQAGNNVQVNVTGFAPAAKIKDQYGEF
ncbi:hypothetical protein IJJ08_03760 [bacterium]|nr:hypothetical protein [bacterium]